VEWVRAAITAARRKVAAFRRVTFNVQIATGVKWREAAGTMMPQGNPREPNGQDFRG
jgi:hypothetical protein